MLNIPPELAHAPERLHDEEEAHRLGHGDGAALDTGHQRSPEQRVREEDPADENHARSIDNLRRLNTASSRSGIGPLRVVTLPFPRPVIMDATVDQAEGYRFVYLLPFGPDVYFTSIPHLWKLTDTEFAGGHNRVAGGDVSLRFGNHQTSGTFLATLVELPEKGEVCRSSLVPLG